MTAAALWPFPGTEHLPQPPLPDLPPARFAIGDRVMPFHWGPGTVCNVQDWAYSEGGRSYIVHHDWSAAPPNFGHSYREDDLQLIEPAPVPAPARETAAPVVGQLDLFA